MWHRGHLEYEIKIGGWDVVPFDAAVIFDRPLAEIWQKFHYRTKNLQEF